MYRKAWEMEIDAPCYVLVMDVKPGQFHSSLVFLGVYLLGILILLIWVWRSRRQKQPVA